ncbi:MAG: hypothetical protein HON68_01705 [Gammaproteobacteria bacterium]|jgi:hypothetical protein|nr:hypothetical protein [Gammaproteobacteria bacterium]MBT3719471.1 hypothetical protein [Gammaproteobacteria bacterium]MBT3844925.1 hypothetical protein [Gammaproteobacteria bacterium]MBT3893167.1 hypothetical protein [Gammaproteobacteria bacterium]MBT4787828.1 hypothetical protein [Gammaproteobacteria bacterium]
MIHALLTVVGLSALVVLVFFFRYFLTGTSALIALASHAGIKGWIAFIGGWLFFSPFMVIGSIIYGYSLLKV